MEQMNPYFAGLEWLATAVMALDEHRCVSYINPAAENLLGLSAVQVKGLPLNEIFRQPAQLNAALDYAVAHNASFTEHELHVQVGDIALQVSATFTPVEGSAAAFMLEFHAMDQQLKIARDEHMLLQQQANRELVRNLAHEIKNPLGGIRGAAQLLEHELSTETREYTQVIIQESDRLQSLMDRLLTPHRLPQINALNIHEVLERVRSVTLAETPKGLIIRRDYDTSIPDIVGDREQLIQVVLNIVRNAVQALHGQGEICLRTRIARQVTLAMKRYPLAAQIQIIDNGPGIPESVRDRIFFPLVSAREGGSGLGLTLAQTFVHQHHGTIEVESQPGRTCFTLLLPLGQLPAYT
ncbi:PAS domain-containing sensor histidine kinase [Sulfuriferula sp. AH1]|uniref:nitrogen regulation protein NR(II) n=1 Tax=Sulfuriferula sp. AH1 TaxID=1985873 RepID=UPI000B3B601C|nr:nitrogen regulation protein NR(II) [Sulfuriferula sp. AH1]ARU30266.1 PAS domain-containing sensor histidine kinase [Sulfuriferula sp. AH1]